MKLGILEKLAVGVLIAWAKKQIKRNKKMAKLWKVFKGKKTNIIAVVALVLGILQHYDVYTVPENIWKVLAAVGLLALRAGVKDVTDQLK